MKLIIITVQFVLALLILLLIYKNTLTRTYENYGKYIIQETPIPGPSDDDNSDCQKYFDFIQQPINMDYYSSPRFLNPQESCRDECVEGVWSKDHGFGSVKCCEAACMKFIKK